MSKTKGLRLEADVDKYRSEQNWEKLKEIIPLATSKGSGIENLAHLLNGEVILESFLESFHAFPTPDKNYRDTETLKKAKDHLVLVKDDHVRAEYHLEAHLLLAKLLYISAHFRDAIEALNNSGLDKHEVQIQTLRSLRLVAEAYAVKGLCQEILLAKTHAKLQKSHKYAQIMASFEKAAEMAVVYLQELDKTFPQAFVNAGLPQSLQAPGSVASKDSTVGPASGALTTATFSGQLRQDLGFLIETAIQRIPIMQIRKDQKDYRKQQFHRSYKHLASVTELTKFSEKLASLEHVVSPGISPSFNFLTSADCLRFGLERYRQFLRLVDRRPAQHLQQVLSRQLAELLLRGFPNDSYVPPMFCQTKPPTSTLTPSHSNMMGFTSSPEASVTPSGTYNIRQLLERQQQRDLTFLPSKRYEEVLLLLMISNSIVLREGVLSRFPEHHDLRESSLKTVIAVQNLLALVLSQLRQYYIMVDFFERAMKLSFNELFLWMQLALALMCQHAESRALQCLNKCIELMDKQGTVQCFEQSTLGENSASVIGRLLKKLKLDNDDSDTDVDAPDGGCVSSRNRSSSVAPLPNNLYNETFHVESCTVHLLAAKQCIEHLGRYAEGIEHAKAASQTCKDTAISSRAYLMLGLGYSLMSETLANYVKRTNMQRDAVEAFKQAVLADPKDHISHFFLAVQFAISRNIPEARKACEQALAMNAEQPASILLMALIMSADGSFADSMDLVQEALEEHPNHFGLLVFRLKLEFRLNKNTKALSTAKDLLLFWKRSLATSVGLPITVSVEASGSTKMYNVDVGSERQYAVAGKPVISVVTDDAQSIRVSRASEAGDKDSVTDAPSIFGTATDLGPAGSSISDSLGLSAYGQQNGAVYVLWRLQANVWLELGELFLDAGKLDEVEHCVEEAVSAFPNSYQALYMKGRLHQVQQRYSEAKSCFAGALSIFPAHVPSLRQLAVIYNEENNLRMAEKILRDLIQIDPVDHLSWHSLGQVLSRLGDAQAPHCFATSLNLEITSPLLPYTVIPRISNM